MGREWKIYNFEKGERRGVLRTGEKNGSKGYHPINSLTVSRVGATRSLYLGPYAATLSGVAPIQAGSRVEGFHPIN